MARKSGSKNTKSDVNEESITLSVNWHVPDSVIARYATHMVVQHTQHEFILTFFELTPPLVVGTPEQRLAQVKDITLLQPQCVGRIVISPGRMPEFIKALSNNFETYLANVEQLEQLEVEDESN